jgi:hypothetical protein
MSCSSSSPRRLFHAIHDAESAASASARVEVPGTLFRDLCFSNFHRPQISGTMDDCVIGDDIIRHHISPRAR